MKHTLIILFSLCTICLQAQDKIQKAFSKGVQLLQSEQFKDAITQFNFVIEKGTVEEKIKMSYIYKGFSYNGLKKYDDAIVCFNKAVEIDALDAATFIDRGLTYAYKNDFPNAIKDFEHVITLDSIGEQAEAAYYYLGKIKMQNYQNKAAISYFDKFIALNQTDYEVYFLRGTAKSNMMNFDGAIADFDKAIALRPNFMEAYANRGVQKINKIPLKDKLDKNIKCIEDPCADFKKAKELGDDSVDDMLFLYCKKCN
jgi:tetratricopeptide (TPR) repeat protein